jgi:hypothetical protein
MDMKIEVTLTCGCVRSLVVEVADDATEEDKNAAAHAAAADEAAQYEVYRCIGGGS